MTEKEKMQNGFLYDANYDEKCLYKATLADFVRVHDIRFLIDLHQMAGFREEQICIGTGRGQNLTEGFDLEACLAAFDKSGLQVSIDRPFAASHPYTVAAYIHRECGIPCLQIEINSNLVREGTDLYAYKRVLEVLEQLVSNES